MGEIPTSGTQSEFDEEPTEVDTDLDDHNAGQPRSASTSSIGAPQPERKRRIITRIGVAAAGLFAVWHIAATALYALPVAPLRELVPEGAFYAYNYPMFDQNWSVFAPDPIAADYEMSVRASRLVDGQLVTTDWVNASETELRLLRHNPLSPRAGYGSYVQSLLVNVAYNKLSDTEKAVVAKDYFEGDTWAQQLESDLRAQEGTDEATVVAFMKLDWVSVSYATQVAKAMWGDDVVYVQYSISADTAVPFASRHDKDAHRTVVAIPSGWRGLVTRPGQNSEHFADFFMSLDPVIIGEEDKK